MELSFSGKLVYLTDPKFFTTKDGSQGIERTLVLESAERFPQQIAFAVYGDNANLPFQLGQQISVQLGSRVFYSKADNTPFCRLVAWQISIF